MSIVGETLLTCALTEIFNKINSVVTEGIAGAWKLEADLEKLRQSIRKIQDAQITADDENFWKLQEVIYCVENVMDEFHYKILRREVENQLKHKLRDFVSLNNPILFRMGMATRVKKLNDKVALLNAPATAAANSGEASIERETCYVLENRPFGRKDEAEEIIEMLQATSSLPSPLTVVSIVGFGGIGKTFLAKLVNQKAQEKKLFDHFIWVCVSEPFHCGKILERMLQIVHLTGGMQGNINALVHHLRQQFEGKRIFLVLDDVWNEEEGKWEDLKGYLKNVCGESGKFVIVVTTRSEVVARTMGSTHTMKLNPLSDIECWSIIKEKVVGDEGESIIYHDMEIIGMDIAKKCGGVPLVAKVLGGVLMRSPLNEDEWSSIQDNNVWNEADITERTLGVLKLSFNRLPSPQKLCFAYCSCFPKDFVFDKAKLIQLWMAEGFVKTTLTNEGRSEKLMEEFGEECFHSLLANSFFQDVEVDVCGNIVGCKMHDILRDLAFSISNSQRLLWGSDCIQTSDGCRLTFSCDQMSEVQKILASSIDKTRNLRSLFCRVDVSPMLSNFKRLRSLDMSDTGLKDLPAAIGKLKHLRYFDVSKNEDIQMLPESIMKLYNLQTLRILRCRSLKELPSKITNLVSLRHLYFDDEKLIPLKVGDLTNLQTLPIFVVGRQEGQRINELEKLEKLRGELWVCGLENVRDKREAERAKMKEKKLSILVLEWTGVAEYEVETISSSREGNHEEVMKGLVAHTDTQSLTVEWYMGKQFPRWMSELEKLVKLKLTNCRKCETMPPLRRLRNLKILEVKRMDSIKVIGGEFYGESNYVDTLFPLLDQLYIREMKSLIEWVTPNETEIFPKLRKLYITDCPNLTSFPLSQSASSAISMQLRRGMDERIQILSFMDVKSLKDMRIKGCPKLTIFHISLSLKSFCVLPDYIAMEQEELVKSLSIRSNELGESWKWTRIKGDIEVIREFPKSLEVLKIVSFDKLLLVEALNGLSSLKHLEIRECPNLESIPNLSSLTSLQHLTISHCSRLASISGLSSLNSLKYLQISECRCYSLELFPTSCLEELHILWYYNLRSIPVEIKLCTSLKVLTVAYCPRIVSIDDDIIGSLTQLKELVWGGFSEQFDQLPGLNLIRRLTSLQKLTIIGWKKLTSLPYELQDLTSITHLVIEEFHGVESLSAWFCNLSSLQTLCIHWCRHLKNLTTGMQRLSKLKSLDIWICPLLEKRCAKGIGPEWSNISHIPFIKIDYEVIQDLRRGTHGETPSCRWRWRNR